MAGHSETSFSSIAESSFISSSMGKNFGIFGRLDFGFGVFLLDFMWHALACRNWTLNRHRFGSAGWKKEFRLGQRLHLFDGGVRSELTQQETLGSDIDKRKLRDDVVDDFHAGQRERTLLQDFRFVVARRVLHGDEDALGASDKIHCAAHAF